MMLGMAGRQYGSGADAGDGWLTRWGGVQNLVWMLGSNPN